MLSATLIDRYMAKSIAVPLFGTLLLAAMLLVLDKMLRLFDFVVNAGGPVNVVWKMLANLLPEYFSLGIPIGLMLGILLAFRKLALSSELDALRGIGMGYGRLLRVPYFYAFVLMAITLLIVGFIEPYSRYRYERLRFDLRSGALGASIKVGEFNQMGRRLTLRVDRSKEHGTRLEGIFIAVDDQQRGSITATAESGRFLATDDPDTILFRLRRGRLVQDSARFSTPRTLAFDSYDLPITMPPIDQFRRRGDDNPELNIIELLQRAGDPKSSKLQRDSAIANFNFRIVEVAMMLLIPLLAVALAVPPKRSTSALGIFVGIIVMVTYHKVNQYAEQMGAQGRVDPVIALWVPFILLAGLILWMFRIIAFVPGGQPIGALERAFGRIGGRLARLLRRRRPIAAS